MTVHFGGPVESRSTEAPALEFVEVKLTSAAYYAFWKRFFDIAFVLISGLVGLILVGLSAFAVLMTGQMPFYRQKRIGRNGRVFNIIKIQTMVPNAEAVLEEFLAQNPAARAEWERDQKLQEDPRITRIGAVLRKTSLDEMPQLWNVLRGDMSIVGPRPMMVCQKELYPGTAYFELRPGITGPWQVSGRSMSSFAARAVYDTDYLHNLSLAGDVRILAQTAKVVLECNGK